MTIVAPSGRGARPALEADPRLAYASAWLLGLAVLALGQVAVRLLVGLMPTHLHFRDPPFFLSIAFHASAAVLWFFASRALRRGSPWARASAILASLGPLIGTFVALNTATIHPGPGASPALEAMTEAWRGVGWPGMLSHAEDFVLQPTGAWRLPQVVAMAVTTVVTLAVLWLSQTGWMRARARRRTGPSSAERIGGFVLAIHVAFHGFLTITGLFALTGRVLERL